jgi:hypothetical protein
MNADLIDAAAGVAVSLLLLSTAACTLKPVTVGVVFDDVWELGKDTLTEPEQTIVKATALRTLRQAFQGFGVVVAEVHNGSRLIFVDKSVPARLGAVGETHVFVTASNVHVEPLYHALLNVVGCDGIATCRGKTRAEMVEALGRGIGATGAHELGHQVFLGFALDSKCEDCYDGRTLTTYDHFFGTKHWSNNALAVMRRVLPRS